MRKILILMCLLQAGTLKSSYAQQLLPPEDLQKMVQAGIAKAYAASVYLADYDTVAKRTNGQRFSGVVVSKEGLILTAAHVGKTGKAYQVIFPDGKTHIAIGLGRIQSLDAAILKISKPDSWPFAEMGWSSSLEINEPCLSIAYPGSFVPQRAVIRFGYVAEPLDEARNMIRTTCLMEPGDSGGPVFDLMGRVIGLHSKITLGLENNYEVPIDVFRKYWSALNTAQDYSYLPTEDKVSVDSQSKSKVSYNKINSVEMMLADKESELDKVTLQITSLTDTNSAVGTIIRPKGLKVDAKKSYIISKSSLMPGESAALMADGKTEKLKVYYRDVKRDLVLFEMDKNLDGGVDISLISKDTLAMRDLGKILISPNPRDEGEVSALGALRFNLPALYSAGYLGSRLELKENHNVVAMVQEKSPAKDAGLKIGDEVLTINKVAIASPEQFIKEMQKNKPNDTIQIGYKRDGIESNIQIALAKRPNITTGHVAERFTDGKSDRRDGFKNVFIHDSKLKPAECGGPVFDLEGNFIGINIARFSRTSSIAITAAEVLDFIQEAVVEHKVQAAPKTPNKSAKS